MNEELENRMVKALESAQEKVGFRFNLDTIAEVAQYSIRKLKCIKKDDDYLPLLFETELCDHAAREEINRKGMLNRVLRMQTNTL